MREDYLDLYLIHFPISLAFVPFDRCYPPEWTDKPENAGHMILDAVPYRFFAATVRLGAVALRLFADNYWPTLRKRSPKTQNNCSRCIPSFSTCDLKSRGTNQVCSRPWNLAAHPRAVMRTIAQTHINGNERSMCSYVHAVRELNR